jgi:hypothetical protein
MAPGTVTTGKIYAALRRLGFDKVFDTNFGADLTIMEEGSELAERLANKDATLPMITTCCPAWVDYLEKYYPEMIPHFSSAKSPHEMVGVMTKTWYAEKNGFTRDQIFHVSIMPCTAKKYEIDRHETMFASGDKDVDVVITTRELARMIKQAGIDFVNLPDEEADDPMGEYTGAATIFGASGGVMEAALRTAYYLLTKEELEDVNFEATRGLGRGQGSHGQHRRQRPEDRCGPPDGEYRQGDGPNQSRGREGRGAPLPLCGSHGLPRGLRRRRRPALRSHGRDPSGPGGGPLQRRRPERQTLLPPQREHQEDLRRLTWANP